MTDAIIAVLFGFIGGFAGGLLGIGGGAIYVPAMVIVLDQQQHVAQGASLAAIVATAIVGGMTHLRQGNVHLPVLAWVAPPAVVAAFGAAFVADALDGDVLRRIFAVVLVYFALRMIVGVLSESPVFEEGESV